MTATPAPTDAVAYVRLLIADTGSDPILSDDEISLLLANASGPLLAAADALDIIASAELLLSKKITTQDLSTDGPAVAAELRKQAAALRARAREEQYDKDWGLAVFSVAAKPQTWPEAVEGPVRGWPQW